MNLSPHLMFGGDCAEAFKLYAELFGGELTMLSYADTPMSHDVAPGWRAKIVHATLSFDGNTLAGADVLPGDYRRPQGFSVLVDVEGPGNARRIFDTLAERGSVQMPMQETFWSPCFGVLVDRFGIPWEINGTSADPAAQRSP